MAMEKIGVGGVLTFESNQAVANMGKASRAFNILQSNFSGFKANMSGLQSAVSGLNLVSMGLGVAGVAGLGAMAHSAIEAKAEFESMQTQLGTTFNVLAGGGKMKEGLALAKTEMQEIERLAVKAPGGASDLLQIYKQIVGPMSVQGQTLEQVRDMTFGASIAAKGLGISFEDMGFGLSKLVAGTIQSDDRIFKMSRSMGLIKMDAAAWNALTPVERQKQLNVIMSKYREAGDAVGATWEATFSTLGDIMTVMKRAFIGPVFDAIKAKVTSFNDAFLANQKRFESMGAALGEYVIPVFNFLSDVFTGLVAEGIRFVGVLKLVKDEIDGVRDLIGPAWEDRIRRIAVAAGMIGVAFATALPVLSLMTTFLGPLKFLFGGLFGLVRGIVATITALPALLALLAPALAPFLAVAAGLGLAFMAFRHDGETAVQTITRLWTDVLKPAWDGFVIGFKLGISGMMEPLLESWEVIKDSFSFLMDYLADSWNIGAGDARSFGAAVGEVLGNVVKFLAEAVAGAGHFIGAIIRAVAGLVYVFKVVGQRIGEVFGMLYLSVRNSFAQMFNQITEPIRLILDFLADTIRTIATTSIGRKALETVGIAPESALSTAASLKALTTTGALSKAEVADIPGFGDLPETPEEEVERKRAARALKEKANAPMKMEGMDITVEDKRSVEVKLNLSVDGKVLSQAQARQQLELSERAGANTAPWQRREVLTRSKAGK